MQPVCTRTVAISKKCDGQRMLDKAEVSYLIVIDNYED